MKKLAFIILSGILAVSLTAGMSFALDKLVVQDGVGKNVFTVDDTGATTATFQATVKDDGYTLLNLTSYSDTQWQGGFFNAMRASGTEAAPTVNEINDVVFTFNAQGYDGTAFLNAGQIIGNVDGTPSPGIIPFRWSFRTMNTAGVLADRMTVKANGNVGIGTTNPTNLLQLAGGAYSNGSTWVNASSRELKKDIVEVSAEEAIQTVESLKPVSFVYKEGNQDVHVGFIAEDVPEMVATPDRKGLESMDIAAVLTKVVQEQQKMLKAQQEAMSQMQDKITTLETALQFKQDKQELAQQ